MIVILWMVVLPFVVTWIRNDTNRFVRTLDGKPFRLLLLGLLLLLVLPRNGHRREDGWAIRGIILCTQLHCHMRSPFFWQITSELIGLVAGKKTNMWGEGEKNSVCSDGSSAPSFSAPSTSCHVIYTKNSDSWPASPNGYHIINGFYSDGNKRRRTPVTI